MGKQLAFVMGQKDEKMFLDFLNSTEDIILIENRNKEKEMLFTNHMSNELYGHYSYYIWNKKFSWTPEFSTTVKGEYYITNTNTAPLVEFSRCWKYDPIKGVGRIYWTKYFLSNNLEYDVEEFNIWYEQIARWIKKSAAGRIKDVWITYFLPDAWNTYLKEIENKEKEI